MKLCFSTAARYAHTRRKRIAQELNELDADDLLQLTEADMQARYALEGAPPYTTFLSVYGWRSNKGMHKNTFITYHHTHTTSTHGQCF